MTTKTNPAAAVTTDVIESVTIPATAAPKAKSLHIFAAIPHALSEAVVHIRQGMTFDVDMPIEVFGTTGQMSFYLKRGNPDAHYVDVAHESSTQAVEMERARYEREVEAAAKRLVEDAARAEKQAAIAAEIAAAEAAVRKLKRTAAAIQ